MVVLTQLCGAYLFLECPDNFWSSTLETFLQFNEFFAIPMYYPLQLDAGLQLLGQPLCTWRAADGQLQCKELRLCHFGTMSAGACAFAAA